MQITAVKPRGGAGLGHRGRWWRLCGIALLTAAVTAVPVQAADRPAAPARPALRAAALPPDGASTGGLDGFTPILYTTTPDTGSIPQAWFIAHHAKNFQAPKVSCVIVSSGELCGDANGNFTEWPKRLSIGTGPLGSETSYLLATTQLPQFVTDGLDSRVVRYPVVTVEPVAGFPNGSVGVGCLNMQSQTNCGYTPLAPKTDIPGVSNVNGLTGFVQVGDSLYGTATDGRQLCYRITVGGACPGQPFAGNTPPNNDRAFLGPSDYRGTTSVIDGKIYITSDGSDRARTTWPHPVTLTCFDPAFNVPCTGWTPVFVQYRDAYRILAIFPRYSPDGTVQPGVCTIAGNKTPAPPIVNCYDGTGNGAPPPLGLSEVFPAGGARSVVFQPLTIKLSDDLRTYFPFYTEDRTYLGQTVCYSWTYATACERSGDLPGFPNPLSHWNVNGGDTHNYGYAYSPARACVYGGGDTGYVFGFNPVTGGTGC
ncbi:hypothetical protein [Nonomuraea sp. NPDC049695]|uniref:hypothetical protein n=1 Tax=Nonomuraea sp. NPDC049695 TaxID=3154734 RepID=UPI0034274E41